MHFHTAGRPTCTKQNLLGTFLRGRAGPSFPRPRASMTARLIEALAAWLQAGRYRPANRQSLDKNVASQPMTPGKHTRAAVAALALAAAAGGACQMS